MKLHIKLKPQCNSLGPLKQAKHKLAYALHHHGIPPQNQLIEPSRNPVVLHEVPLLRPPPSHQHQPSDRLPHLREGAPWLPDNAQQVLEHLACGHPRLKQLVGTYILFEKHEAQATVIPHLFEVDALVVGTEPKTLSFFLPNVFADLVDCAFLLVGHVSDAPN